MSCRILDKIFICIFLNILTPSSSMSNQSQTFEDRKVLFGFHLSGNEQFYLGDEGIFFYGLETSLDLHGYSIVSIGIVSSFEFHAFRTGKVFMDINLAPRLGSIININRHVWLHPYGLFGYSYLDDIVEKETDYGGGFKAQHRFFFGAGAGASWMQSESLGLSTDVVLTYILGNAICLKLRIGILYKF